MDRYWPSRHDLPHNARTGRAIVAAGPLGRGRGPARASPANHQAPRRPRPNARRYSAEYAAPVPGRQGRVIINGLSDPAIGVLIEAAARNLSASQLKTLQERGLNGRLASWSGRSRARPCVTVWRSLTV